MHESSTLGEPSSAPRTGRTRGTKVLRRLIAVSLGLAFATAGVLFAQSAPSKETSATQTASQADSSAPQSADLSDEVSHDVLASFQHGLESHSLDQVLAVFDAENMKDYSRFHDQMVAFFRLHDSIKFRYQLLQVTENKGIAFATADVEMDADPTDLLPTEHRRTAQMRFQLKRVGTTWKVTDLNPIDFFTQ